MMLVKSRTQNNTVLSQYYTVTNQLNAKPVVKQRNMFADLSVFQTRVKKGKQTTNKMREVCNNSILALSIVFADL